jgi:hypothetical protein
MSVLTREDIRGVLGPVDDMLAAEIAATNATEAELREAYAWVMSDDALVDELRPLPKGRVAKLTEILQAQFAPDVEEP